MNWLKSLPAASSMFYYLRLLNIYSKPFVISPCYLIMRKMYPFEAWISWELIEKAAQHTCQVLHAIISSFTWKTEVLHFLHELFVLFLDFGFGIGVIRQVRFDLFSSEVECVIEVIEIHVELIIIIVFLVVVLVLFFTHEM